MDIPNSQELFETGMLVQQILIKKQVFLCFTYQELGIRLKLGSLSLIIGELRAEITKRTSTKI